MFVSALRTYSPTYRPKVAEFFHISPIFSHFSEILSHFLTFLCSKCPYSRSRPRICCYFLHLYPLMGPYTRVKCSFSLKNPEKQKKMAYFPWKTVFFGEKLLFFGEKWKKWKKKLNIYVKNCVFYLNSLTFQKKSKHFISSCWKK